MRSSFSLIMAMLCAPLAFWACGDGGSDSATNSTGKYATEDDLPNCTESREGVVETLTSNGYVYECTDGAWEFVSAPVDTVASLDDLPNCTDKIENDSAVVESENAIYKCDGGKWRKVRSFMVTVKDVDDLMSCTSKREGDSAYVTGLHAIYGCEDGKWSKLVSLMDTVKTLDDLTTCSDKYAGDSAYVKKDSCVYICAENRWRLLGVVVEKEDDMKNCTENRDGMQVFLAEEGAALICRNGKWYSFKIEDLIQEDKKDEAEEPESSSSTNKWEVLPVSSSSAKNSSSSSVKNGSSSSVLESSSSSYGESSSAIFVPEDEGVVKVSNCEAIHAGVLVKFNARFAVDYDYVDYTQETEFLIDSLKYFVLNSKDELIDVNPAFNQYTGQRDRVSLADLGVGLSLDDPNFNECGTLFLLVNVYVHLGESKKTSFAKLEFNRAPELFCKEEPASSSGTQISSDIEMVSYTVDMSTDQLPGLDLASGMASNSTTADLVLSKVSGGVSIASGNGTLFSPITNDNDSNFDDDYDVYFWPEEENGRLAVVSDFKFNSIDKNMISDAVEAGCPSSSIYVAKTVDGDPETGEGFYAFGVVAAKARYNGHFGITLKVYKKK